MRGKRLIRRACVDVNGITPAGAGKTRELEVNFVRCQDHPRRCGENSLLRQGRFAPLGSPPQVRGKPLEILPAHNERRITPAGAGKTFPHFACLDFVKDHPRRCGENGHLRRRQRVRPGSPPQVRGKLSDLANTPANSRITPAGAGKTSPIESRCTCWQDHPRRCGENRVYPYLT